MIVQATDQLDHTGHTLSHAERGLVDQQKALPYLRSVSLNMSSVNRRVKVATRDDRRQGATIKTHEIDEISVTSESVVELEPTTSKDAASRFYSNAERRITQRLSRKQQLQWFDERETALKFIRERITRAKKAMMIVDPYADGEDLFNFGHFITRRDIALSLLTSRLPFEDGSAMIANFERALQTFQQRGLPTPEIRILSGGKNPPIHDRFLVIDGDVWLSGNSLNAIGARASVMLKLPDPASVRARLEKYFGNAQPLDNIVAPK